MKTSAMRFQNENKMKLINKYSTSNLILKKIHTYSTHTKTKQCSTIHKYNKIF